MIITSQALVYSMTTEQALGAKCYCFNDLLSMLMTGNAIQNYLTGMFYKVYLFHFHNIKRTLIF